MGNFGPLPPQHQDETWFRFHCPACCQILTIPVALCGTQGPCPTCGTWLAAPFPPPAAEPLEFQPAPAPTGPKRKRGHLLADTTVDYEHTERLENLQILKIIGLAVLVLSFCLAVAWFMREWMKR